MEVVQQSTQQPTDSGSATETADSTASTTDSPPGPTPNGQSGATPRAPPTADVLTSMTIMETLFADPSQMNRLVDRLYTDFERKSRLERERRGY